VRRSHLASLIVLFASLSLSAFADDWSKTFSITGTADVHVDANDAEIEVHAADGKQIDVRVTTHGWKIGPGDVQVTDRQTGDRLEIQVRRPNRHFCIGVCNQGVRVELTVPRQSNLDLHSGDGNIRVSDVRGDLRLDSGDGNIEARSVDGKLNADTRDGNVRTDGRYDGLDLHTGDGNVEADVRSGSQITAGWVIRTGDGRLEIRLPQEFAADLDAHTGDGHVNVDFPVTVSGSMRENSVRGKMNGGGPLLELRTGDGDIRVEKM
jgi:hypothetical protein